MKLRLKFEEVALKNKCEIIEGDNSIFAGYTERADDKFEIELLFVGDNLNKLSRIINYLLCRSFR
jgi:hypothetical protein